MNALKEALILRPVLEFPNAIGHTFFDTDAYIVRVGCVLLQQQEDRTTKPIGYWSRYVTDAELKYDTTEREYLPIVWAVRFIHLCLKRIKLTITTDHYSLKWILNPTESIGRLARWRLRLLELEFHIIFRAGIKQRAADALSRLSTTEEDTKPLEDNFPILAIDENYNLGETQTCVIDITKDDFIQMENENEGPLLVTTTKEKEFPMKHSQDTYCRTTTLQIGCH